VVVVWQESQILNLKRALVIAAASHPDRPSQSSAAVKPASLESQAKCSEQALKLFTSLGYAENKMGEGQENHYQPLMNRCFVLITYTTSRSTNRELLDAFERRELGYFSGQLLGQVDGCNVTLPSGELKVCRSEEEFKRLIGPYMGT
jgi:hypothetical protein